MAGAQRGQREAGMGEWRGRKCRATQEDADLDPAAARSHWRKEEVRASDTCFRGVEWPGYGQSRATVDGGQTPPLLLGID